MAAPGPQSQLYNNNFRHQIDRAFDLSNQIVENCFQLVGKLVDQSFDLAGNLTAQIGQVIFVFLESENTSLNNLIDNVCNIISDALRSKPDIFKDIVKHLLSDL